MSAFNPISPRHAADLVQRAGITEAHKVLVDFASAGLVRGYARLIETAAPAGEPSEIRDLTIPRKLWRHVIDHQKIEDVFTTGTVELFGPGSTSGGPHLKITGIRFGEPGVLRLVVEHGVPEPSEPDPKSKRPAKSARTNAADSGSVAGDEAPEPDGGPSMEHTPLAETPGKAAPATRTKRTRSQAAPILPDAELLTVEQSLVMMQIGRTKLYKLIEVGELETVKHGKRMTRVLLSSVRAWIERNKQGSADRPAATSQTSLPL